MQPLMASQRVWAMCVIVSKYVNPSAIQNIPNKSVFSSIIQVSLNVICYVNTRLRYNFFHAFNQVNPVITLNLCYNQFFVRFNTEEPIAEHGTKIYIYLTTAVSSPQNWFGLRLRVFQ
jgi:hypothetical protein